MRYLGIDYGEKRIGLALSDEAGRMGFPLRVLPNTPKALETLVALIADEKVGAIVLGESINYAGGPNPIARDAQVLGEALSTRAGVPIFYEPETLTTAEARRIPEAPEHVDASAAALILTSYLSKLHDTAR